MKNSFKRILCLLLVLAMSGCAVQEQEDKPSINIIDAGALTTAASLSCTEEPDVPAQGSSSVPQSSSVSETAAPVETVEVILPQESEPQPEVTEQSTADTSSEVIATEAQTTEVSTTAQTTPASTTAATTPSTTTPAEIPVEVPVVSGSNSYTALNHSEVMGVWISYLEYAELMTGKSESAFRENISEVFDNVRELGLNTVYVHARSHGDAYYESELFPWSKYASGSLNVSPEYDPLEIMVEEAHERDISIHAWINPLRLCSAKDMAGYGDYTVSDWYGDGKYVVEVGGTCYLNPAYDEVTELISQGAAEIVANYDVDGLHIDDYFYPTTEAWFDSSAFAESGESLLSDFRFANCDRLVKSLCNAVKAANSSALFSVSVQGSIENNYNLMYADVEKWCGNEGYLDYIVPQIYYGFDNSTQPYSECLSRWEKMCSAGGVPLVVGLTVSKIGSEDVWAGEGRYEWVEDTAILARQLTEARECVSYAGACLYSYRSIYSADSSVSEKVWAEIDGFCSLI